MENMDSLKRAHYNKYRKYFKSDDLEGFMCMYEQIKSEVANSVFQWLNLYVANDAAAESSGGDLKSLNVQRPSMRCTHGPERMMNSVSQHCDGNSCSRDPPMPSHYRRSGSKQQSAGGYNGRNSMLRSPEYTKGYNESVGSLFSTPNSLDSVDSHQCMRSGDSKKKTRRSDKGFDCGPNDPDLISTQFRAGQVWPNWCQWVTEQEEVRGRQASGGGNGNHRQDSVYQCPVVYDQINDRLCVYRQGMIEYPQTPPPAVVQQSQPLNQPPLQQFLQAQPPICLASSIESLVSGAPQLQQQSLAGPFMMSQSDSGAVGAACNYNPNQFLQPLSMVSMPGSLCCSVESLLGGDSSCVYQKQPPAPPPPPQFSLTQPTPPPQQAQIFSQEMPAPPGPFFGSFPPPLLPGMMLPPTGPPQINNRGGFMVPPSPYRSFSMPSLFG